MDTSSINAQSIFDDNAAVLKLSWLTGHEGWERGFSAETVAYATSSADLVLNTVSIVSGATVSVTAHTITMKQYA